MRYDYYTIGIPGDAFETLKEASDCAIDEARDRASLYCIPCDWCATVISGEIGDYEITFRVRRRRN